MFSFPETYNDVIFFCSTQFVITELLNLSLLLPFKRLSH